MISPAYPQQDAALGTPLQERSATRSTSPLRAGMKWAMDMTVALFLFLLTLPLVLFAMALVKLTSRGPAIYSQTRLGKNGRPFTIYKLRTMTQDAERNGACWSLPGDSRVTPIGRWLRKTHLDELPQLWNVLKGDMSLVGPRPERPEFVPQLEQAIPHYGVRLQVRPGVTGLAQVQLLPDSDLGSVQLKLAYDIYYVHHAGLWLDLRVCWATFFHMLSVPFSWLRVIFGFPPKSRIEAEYQGRLIDDRLEKNTAPAKQETTSSCLTAAS